MKIREALRRLLARYFGVGATSVSPQKQPVFPREWFKTEGIKPPPDPGADGWTWEAWDREQRAMTQVLSGWTPCRFAHRRGPQARFVFGMVRNGFGLWKQSMTVNRVDGEGNFSTFKDVLTCVTHIRSGSGLGVFEKIETAAMACDIAGKAFDGWDKLVDVELPLWKQAEGRILGAWYDLGIVPATNSHCVESNGVCYCIYGLSMESAMVGKPEKLS